MIIRAYRPEDCGEMAELFYNTVHTVNAKDYTKEQLDVWATGQAISTACLCIRIIREWELPLQYATDWKKQLRGIS